MENEFLGNGCYLMTSRTYADHVKTLYNELHRGNFDKWYLCDELCFEVACFDTKEEAIEYFKNNPYKFA